MTQPTSAVVVRIHLPPGLARIRCNRDRAASLGVPPHVTILYPFLPRPELTAAVRDELGSIASEVRAFDVRFASVARWPGVVYLEPEPRAPFAALIERIAARWPEHPPYEGTIDEVIPHLTIVEADGPLDDVPAAVRPFLPITATAAGLAVLVEADDGRWRTRWRLLFRP